MAALEVPPLSLQTLVENSVKYAVSPRREGAAITISARNGVIRVTDDGPGFSPEALPAGHGIDLLQGRLQALFPGEDSRLAFERAPDSMTVVVRLPAPVAA
jgi:LytS/YehU family sensor histidine kinase